MSRVFEKNVETWAHERPLEAFHLQNAETDAYPLVKNPNGSVNLKTPAGFFYSNEPEKDAEEWFKGLSLKGVQVLYVYGVGLGYYYLPLRKWLKEDSKRHAVFFEDDLAVLKRFFEQDLAAEVLADSQVNVTYVENPEDEEGALETIYWSFMQARYTISALNFYALKKHGIYDDFKMKIIYSSTTKNAQINEYLKYGVGFFKNFYPNILELHHSFWGNKLFEKFNGVPAIICGAGPSLDKQLPLLAKLKSRALIFAGGSSLNGLSARNVLPHFGAGIDPNPTQFLRLSSSQAYEVPFFYRSRMLTDAFRMIRGPRLYISGAGGYDLPEFYEEELGLTAEYLDEGHNVVNFCTEIATRMGCSPIIYIGMDLAFTGMKAYSGGIDAKDSVTEQELLASDDEDLRAIQRTDIYGKPIYTLWKWISESDWLSAFARNHPEVKLINSTEGGIGFPDVPNIPFKEAVESHLQKGYDLIGRVHGEIQQAKIPQVTADKLTALTKQFQESLTRCIQWIDLLYAEAEKQIQLKVVEPTAPSGQAALAETELYEEAGYKYLLDLFHQVYARLQTKKATALRLNKEKLTEAEIHAAKLRLQCEKLQFMRNAALANLAMIEHAFKTRLSEEKAKVKPSVVPSFKGGAAPWIKENEQLLYYTDGQLKHRCHLEGDIIQGAAEFYSETGTLLAATHYTDNMINGVAHFFYPDGKLFSSQHFYQGRWNGSQEFYNPDGSLKTRMHYVEGKLDHADLG